jgi:hypothetical protein
MTKPREICTAHVQLNDVQAASARYAAELAEIFARDNPGDTIPAHWRAVKAELPEFLKHLKQCGIILDLPAMSSPEAFLDLLKKEFLSGPVTQSAWVGYFTAGEVKDRLLRSATLSAEERASVPCFSRVKELLLIFSEREQPDYVGKYKAAFCFHWPDEYVLKNYAKNQTSEFMRYLLRKSFLSDPPNEQGSVGPFTAEEIRAQLIDSATLSADLKAAIPPIESFPNLLSTLDHNHARKGVIQWADKSFSIYWPDAYAAFLQEIDAKKQGTKHE